MTTTLTGPLGARSRLTAALSMAAPISSDNILERLFLRRFSGPTIGSVGGSCFVDDFVSCWGKRGAYRLLLEPS